MLTAPGYAKWIFSPAKMGDYVATDSAGGVYRARESMEGRRTFVLYTS
jgi:hypothetical protein